MWYRVLTDGVVVLHFAYILFVTGGALLVLKWRRVAWVHVAAVIWGAYIEFTGTICPLTPLEQRLRLEAGQAGYSGGFIEHYLIPLMYPGALTARMQVMLGVVVVLLNLTLYGFVTRRWRRRGAGSTA